MELCWHISQWITCVDIIDLESTVWEEHTCVLIIKSDLVLWIDFHGWCIGNHDLTILKHCHTSIIDAIHRDDWWIILIRVAVMNEMSSRIICNRWFTVIFLSEFQTTWRHLIRRQCVRDACFMNQPGCVSLSSHHWSRHLRIALLYSTFRSE